MAYANIAVALLAAGQGKRFGGDKLSADLSGTPVGLMAARTLADMDFKHLAVIARSGATQQSSVAQTNPGLPRFARNDDSTKYHHALAPALADIGFQILINDQPDLGQSHSLHIAVRAAEQAQAKALLVCLADMPFVKAAHIANIIAKANHYNGIIASHNGIQAMPPALFPRDCWPQLLDTKGDAGARFLLAGAVHIYAPPETLIDIDTVQDLAAAQDGR
jgi:molybdenum cofactor cytidylyltransferase